MLLNINRNKETMSTYEEQLATGKKIQRPSDDPIVAVRALKFRTNVSEIEQYKSNAEDAISWASVTEQGITNVTDIMKRIRELSVQATSDIMNIENRKNVVTEIDQLMEQFMNEMNTTYAGRYVYGGYKTDVPLIFQNDTTDTYELTESFTPDDVEQVQRVVNDMVIDSYRIRLGYDELGALVGTTVADITALAAFNNVNSINSTDPNAYTPAVGDVNFLADTGELIFNQADIGSIPSPLNISYSKTGFERGDLVPDQYFTGTNTTTGDTFVVDNEEIRYKVSYSQEITVNTMAYDVVGVDMARDIEELVKVTKDIAADSSLTSELEEDILGDMFGALIGKMDEHINTLLNTRANIGTKINRLDLTINRLDEDKLNFTDLLSKNEDIDFAEVMIKMSSMETVYNASLQASSKIIQPTLLDFIR